MAHALVCLSNVGACGPSVPQPPSLTYLKKLQCTKTCIFSVLEFCHFLKRGWAVQKSISRIDPIGDALVNHDYLRELSSSTA